MSQRHLGIGFESTWNTAVAPTVFDGGVLREAIRDEVNREEIRTIRNVSVDDWVLLNRVIRGDFESYMNYQTIAYYLYLFYGVAPTTTLTGPYQHVFPPSGGLPATFREGVSATFEARRGASNLNWRYSGSKVTGLSMTGGVDGVNKQTCSILAANEARVAQAAASYADLDLMKPQDTTINFDGSAVDFRRWAFNATFEVDEPLKGGSTRLAIEPQDLNLAVAGNVECYFADTTEYDLFANDSTVDLQIVCTDGTHSMTLNVNQVKLTQATPPVEGRDRLIATYEYAAKYDADSTESFQAIIVDDNATIP